MKYFLYVMVGFLSAMLCHALGYKVGDFMWWAISLPIIIVFNSIILVLWSIPHD